tara:strand:- start:202 stop:426 length:225 start_codon:yes stop_codon:yes gene_type:complete
LALANASGESKVNIDIHDVTDITIGPIQSKENTFWRKIKIKTRRGPHEIVLFEAPWARADKGENLEITLSDEPV